MRRIVFLVITGLMLFGGGCKSDSNDLASLALLQTPNTPTDFSAMTFASGLTSGGFTASVSQTISGNLSDQAANLIQNGVFTGSAKLLLNGQALDLSLSPAGSYSQAITLSPGPNQIWIETFDALGRLCSRSATTEVNCAGSGVYEVTLNAPNLASFPVVNLTLMVTRSGANVSDLSVANFKIVNAGKVMSLTSFTNQGAGQYSLSYTDITCGKRDVFAYIASGAEFGASATNNYGQNYALLVGINDYHSCPAPQPANLSNCVNDALDMQATLLTSSQWASANITLLTDYTGNTGDDIDQNDVLTALNAIKSQMQNHPEDQFVFFYSSHGSGKASNGTNGDSQYLVTNSADWISVNELDSWLKNGFPNPNAGAAAGLANIVVLLDACYSGNFIGAANALGVPDGLTLKYAPFPDAAASEAEPQETFAKSLNATANICGLTAATGNQSSYDVSDLHNGAFTYYLAKALGYGHGGANLAVGLAPGNANQDVWLSLQDEVYSYVRSNTASYGQYARCSDNDANAASSCRLFSN